MKKSNYIIVHHNRHTDDKYFILINVTYADAKQKEYEIAEKLGWASYAKYGDYGLSDDYYIEMTELTDDQIIFGK